MIPVIYAGNITNPKWTSLTWDEAANTTPNNNSSNPNLWFDYTTKQWANAVTVKPEALSKYQNKHVDSVDNNDVLGYWVYIPRYAYEVMRPNAVDKVVQAQNFDIRFETADDVKKNPHPTCNILNPTRDQMWKDGNADNNEANILAKDYRTECTRDLGFSRDYPGNTVGQSDEDKQNNENSDTTWATHPAFTWQYTRAVNNIDYTKELNGFWVGKFETTGTIDNPTVKPNQWSIARQTVEVYTTAAASVGKKDCNNPASNNNGNKHNLATAQSHMAKDAEWGAIAYLSSSRFGAGVLNTHINSAYNYSGTDSEGNRINYGTTGCGPRSAENLKWYDDGVNLSDVVESKQACSQSMDLAYQTDNGRLASTTNNVYGIYDMAGGAYEITNSAYYTISSAVTVPYGNIYSIKSISQPWSAEYMYGDDSYPSVTIADGCTWKICGGVANIETTTLQSVSSYYFGWGRDISIMPNGYKSWSMRGDYAYGETAAGLFTYSHNSGRRYDDLSDDSTAPVTFRVVIQ